MQKKWSSFFFFAIIVIASILRFGGINNGYPPYHSDEGMSYAQGISMVRENTLDGDGYGLALAYPNVIPLINAIFFKIFFIPFSWVKFYITHIPQVVDGLIKLPLDKNEYLRIFQLNILGEREINVLIWGRIIAASFGVGVVILGYLISKKIFGNIAAIVTATLITVNFRQVLNSHLDLPDIYNAFFLMLSVIFSYRIFNSRRATDYLLAGVFIGLSMATKFHVYAVFPFLVSYAWFVIGKKISFKSIILDQKLYIAIISGLFIFILVNPIHLVKVEQMVAQLLDVSLKYGINRAKLSPYPFWYLFNIGIGKLTTVLVGIGTIVMAIRKPKQFLFLGLPVFFFFFVITYMTNGGFYTRNFVTITPLLLIFPGFLLATIFELRRVISRIIAIPVFSLLFLVLVCENLSNSIVVPLEYSKPWNYMVSGDWISKNIPKNSRVAAHSSVPLPVGEVTRLPFEQGVAFSKQEFINEKADYAIMNFDWESNDFYDWMNSPDLPEFKKPIEKLESQYSAMAIRELSDFTIYNLIKPWQAPESNFVVSKIPKYTVSDKKLIGNYSNLSTGWKSESFEVENFEGIEIKGYVSNGFIFINLYKSKDEVDNISKRVAVSVSDRNFKEEYKFVSIVTQIPNDVRWATIGFSSNSPDGSGAKEILIYNAKVGIDFGGVQVQRLKIDENIIFPNSHGNL